MYNIFIKQGENMDKVDIQRIDSYKDSRFDQEALDQHGCFIVNGKYPYQFKIIYKDSALVDGDRKYIKEVIDEFRFFSEHISKFYASDGRLIGSFEPVSIFKLAIDKIQPSQFYVDEEKINAIKSFVKSPEDIIIPIAKYDNLFISLDGHTRLKLGDELGSEFVYAYLSEDFEGTDYFVKECQKRSVFSPKDLIILTHEDFDNKWNKFCDDYFNNL